MVWPVSGTRTRSTRVYISFIWNLQCTIVSDIVIINGTAIMDLTVVGVACRFRVAAVVIYRSSEDMVNLKKLGTAVWLAGNCFYNREINEYWTPKKIALIDYTASMPAITCQCLLLSAFFSFRHKNKNILKSHFTYIMSNSYQTSQILQNALQPLQPLQLFNHFIIRIYKENQKHWKKRKQWLQNKNELCYVLVQKYLDCAEIITSLKD